MIHTQHERFTLHHGDNRDVLKELPDNSIDSIVTDPPYELGFMGKSWDASGIAFNVEVWQECLRVLKPGGHLLAFSGSRTYHRMAVAIEDAGFEIRDQIMWIYGSGFPKSLDVSKAIDKAAGAEREIIGETKKGAQTESTGRYGAWGDGITPTAPATDFAKQWQGWGTALKPAHEPIVVARKPLIGTVAANVLTYGTGGLNIDASRVGKTVETWPKSRSYPYGGDVTYGSKNAPTELTQEAPAGRWPANVIHDGSDEVVELFPETKGKMGMKILSDYTFSVGEKVTGAKFASQAGLGDSGSAARFFYCAKANKRDRNEGVEGFEIRQAKGGGGGIGDYLDDVNSASGKFGSEKAPSQNHHPTVKPTDLMRYLCRLVTPPDGIVFDPFVGSGSTGKAAMYEGFNFIGIELTEEYLPIAKARIEFALNNQKEILPNA